MRKLSAVEISIYMQYRLTMRPFQGDREVVIRYTDDMLKASICNTIKNHSHISIKILKFEKHPKAIECDY